MNLSNLSPTPGAVRGRYRRGRGTSSGNGKTAGRGHKGQWSRSGGGVRAGFEGGQLPLIQRLTKRGFTNIFATRYAIVNIRDLERVFEDGATVDAEALIASGLLKKTLDGIKLLAAGETKKKFVVKVNAVSDAAKRKIEAAGGTIEVV